MTAALAVARRSVLKTLRTPPVIVFTIAQGAVFLLIFRYVFGGAIQSGPLSYVDFMTPGLIVVGLLFTTWDVGTSVAEDLNTGVLDRFRSLPMPRSAVLVGRCLAQLVLVAITLSVTTAIGLAVGFRPHAGWAGLAGMLGLCLLAGAAFTWVFILVGLATGNVQAAQGLGFLVMPASFASSAFVPTASMPGWLRAFAEHQPVTALVNAARHLTQGPAGAAASSVPAAIGWCVAIMAVAVPASVALFRRR